MGLFDKFKSKKKNDNSPNDGENQPHSNIDTSNTFTKLNVGEKDGIDQSAVTRITGEEDLDESTRSAIGAGKEDETDKKKKVLIACLFLLILIFIGLEAFKEKSGPSSNSRTLVVSKEKGKQFKNRTGPIKKNNSPSEVKEQSVATEVKTPEVEAKEGPVTTTTETPEMEEKEGPVATTTETPEMEAKEVPAATNTEAPEMEEKEVPIATTTETSEMEAKEDPIATTTEAPEMEEKEVPVATNTEAPEVVTKEASVATNTKTTKMEENDRPVDASKEMIEGAQSSEISIPEIEESNSSMKKEDLNTNSEIAKDIVPLEEQTYKEFQSAPDYERFGRGLVYNCKGGHWACLDKPSYFQCIRNTVWSKENAKLPSCVEKGVYASNRECELAQIYHVNTRVDVKECN